MTLDEERKSLKKWYLDECRKIEEKYPHVKYQFDPGDAEDKEQRKLDKELKRKFIELRKKYGK